MVPGYDLKVIEITFRPYESRRPDRHRQGFERIYPPEAQSRRILYEELIRKSTEAFDAATGRPTKPISWVD